MIIFQTLPTHIISKVIYYLVRDNPTNFSRNNGYGIDNGHLCRPLLTISRRWRFVVQEKLYSECYIFIRGVPAEMTARSRFSGPKANLPSLFADYFARNVHIHIQLASIVSGSIDNALACFVDSSRHFYATKKLHVYFEFDDNPKTIGFDDAAPYIDSFASSLFAIMPHVHKIYLYHTHSSTTYNTPEHDIANSLSRQLFSRVQHRNYIQGGVSIQAAILPTIIGGLTNINCDWDNSYAHAGTLICHNAVSLLKLTVTFHHYRDIKNIFKDCLGRPIFYLQLQMLKLLTSCNFDKQSCVSLDNVILFPQLACLVIEAHYPFLDDLPLRGNGSTLKHLNIPFDCNTILVLEQAGTLSKSRYPQIQYLQVMDSERSIEARQLPMDDVFQLILDLAPTTFTLSLVGIDAVSQILASTQHKNNLCQLQTLYLHASTLELTDIIRFLNFIPHLSYIYSGASDLYEISENDALALLRSYPFSEGVPLGKHFVRWELGSLEMEPAYNIAMCAIFLATTCPKFIHIQTPRFSDTEHLSIIKNTLDLPAYASLKARALTLLRA